MGGESRRSQPLMRRPVERVPAAVTFQGGEQLECTLFLPLNTDIVELFAPGARFIPIGVGDGVRIVARDGIVCVAIQGNGPTREGKDECQKVTVHLRSGDVVLGDLWWSAPAGSNRTTDFLNEPAPHLVLHGAGVTTYVAKSHIVWITEV
jgi:hypothetical protein